MFTLLKKTTAVAILIVAICISGISGSAQTNKNYKLERVSDAELAQLKARKQKKAKKSFKKETRMGNFDFTDFPAKKYAWKAPAGVRNMGNLSISQMTYGQMVNKGFTPRFDCSQSWSEFLNENVWVCP